MYKIWAKIMLDGHISSQFTYSNSGIFNADLIFNDMLEICYHLDIPMPLLLRSHINSMSNFNLCKFKRSDFVEKVNLDALTLEIIA